VATTSGSVATVQIDVATIIETAVRRCGLLPGSLTTESLNTAKTNLFLLMSALVNKGAPLWTVEKIVMGMNVNQFLLQLPVGTIDIRNALYRYNVLPSGGTAYSSAGGIAANAFAYTGSGACTQTSPNGYISYNFGSQIVIPTVGFLPNTTHTLNPVYEWSNDGVTWTSYATASLSGGMAGSYGSGSYLANQWYWQDINQPISAQYFRLRETSGGTLDIASLVFGQPAREITISRSNADDYQNLPYKNQTGGSGRPLQYWFDRQIQPQMWMWPASQYAYNAMVIWARRQLQDVGTFTNVLEFPDRWLDAVISDLACRLAYELQGVNFNRIPLLEAKAKDAMQDAWQEERDKSPIYFSANISPYTRGGR